MFPVLFAVIYFLQTAKDVIMANEPNLFSPLQVRSITLRNRIGISPMCQYNSVDGFANDWHLVHLGSRTVGGAALIMTEAAAVEPRGRISPDDLGIWSDDHVTKLLQITAFIKQYGGVPGMQIAHAGRKASTLSPWKRGSRSERVDLSNEQGGWDIVAPSAIPFSESARVPHELSIPEIKEIQQKFVEATTRAQQAGFQWVELHAAHGYLAHSFYSPLSNKRKDEYGGSFENRVRFVVETAEAMRLKWPEELPFAVRISASDWTEGGWTIEDSVRLATILKSKGVDLIDASSGFVIPGVHYPQEAGWQVPLAERIKRESGILTAAVGLITDAEQADQIIERGQADLVFIARQSMRDPYFPYHASKDLGIAAPTLPPIYTYAL